MHTCIDSNVTVIIGKQVLQLTLIGDGSRVDGRANGVQDIVVQGERLETYSHRIQIHVLGTPLQFLSQF